MRETVDFNKDWLFHKGDLKPGQPLTKGYMYIGAKTERYHMGPASKEYYAAADSYALDREQKPELWCKVDLPHDYVIEGIPDRKYNCAHGFLPYDNAWYIKRFRLSAEDKNKRITLLFEGVATHATVYLNGCLMKHNFCGYTSFEVDVTDVVKYDAENVLSVYVSTEEHEGWWYEGGGIYRNVKMIKTDLVSVDLWGIYAKPVRNADGTWTVHTQTTVRNDDVKNRSVRIVGEIADENGNVVCVSGAGGTVENKDKRTFEYRFEIADPELWSPDSPVQYVMRARIFSGKTPTDESEVRFGFRTFTLDPDRGLFINGKHYKIKGVCGHADCGLTGKAVPDNLHEYKVRLMKEMGANGYRTSHYPQAEALMDALDANGFIVMDETRWFESTDEGKAQLEMLMKRDRNRPGVFFWSVGNEEPHHVTEEGRRICRSLMALARKLDDSRVIMTAVSHSPDKATVYDELDAIGINYNWQTYETVHKKYPGKAVFSSECCATGTTRGWYFDDDPGKAFITAYDHDVNPSFRGREFVWKYIAERDWLLGGYQWIAFEHRGEATWPRLCSQSGAIDLFLQKKDAFYQNKSHWTDEPMVHVLPHWNFEGLEGVPIKVVAYTNCEALELAVNGVSQGKKDIEKYGHGEWLVPYQPGYIEVRGFVNGKVAATERRETAGAPKKLVLELETPDVRPNGRDIAIFSCYCVDEKGREVPTATPTVSFTASGAGRIYSTGSDITEHDTIFKSERKMRAGRIGVAVKMGESGDELTVIASAEGLSSAYFSKKMNLFLIGRSVMKVSLRFVSYVSAAFEADFGDGSVYTSSLPFSAAVDGVPVGNPDGLLVFPVYGLEPGSRHVLTVTREGETVSLEFRTPSPRETLVLQPVPGDNTSAIQGAMDSLPPDSLLVLEAGTYPVVNLFLRSGLTLYLKKGAVLLAQTDRAKWQILDGVLEKTADGETVNIPLGNFEGAPAVQFASVLTGLGVKDVSLVGEGTVDGNAGMSDWWVEPKKIRLAQRPHLFYLNGCRDVRVQGLTFRNSPSWTLHPFFSAGVGFYGVTVVNPKDSPNTDACDPDCCSRVEILGCRFSVGDDCLVLKSGKRGQARRWRKPCESVTTRNCLMENGHGAVVLGSEIGGGVRDLTVEKCLFRGTDRGLRIKTCRGRGDLSVVDGVAFRDIRMEGVLNPFVVNMFYFCDPDGKSEKIQSKDPCPVTDETPYIGALLFENVVAADAKISAAFAYGLPERKIGSLTFRNVKISMAESDARALPAMMCGIPEVNRLGMFFCNVGEVVLDNVSLKGQAGDPVLIRDVDRLTGNAV